MWERGYASALGKKVYAYMDNSLSYLERFNTSGNYVDKDGKIIEDVLKYIEK